MIDVVVILPLNNDEDPCWDILYQNISLRILPQIADFFVGNKTEADAMFNYLYHRIELEIIV